jgi:DNA-3-methyladenine glycosylase I
MEPKMPERCPWCGNDPLYVAYHDTEWGVPERDSRALFEKLSLEAFQAGLSWYTILKKRENFRSRFAQFDPKVLAEWSEVDIAAALNDAGIVRHRGKIEATVGNAQAWLRIEERTGFSAWLWAYVEGKPHQNAPVSLSDVPAETSLSRQISKDLKKAGFRFCGPTIVYAFLQAAGLVNDHLTSCYRASDQTE